MTDLLAYAAPFRAAGAAAAMFGGGGGGGARHIASRGSQFALPQQQHQQQFVVRPPAGVLPPRRKRSRGAQQQQQQAGGPRAAAARDLEHAQAALTSPDWRSYGRGAVPLPAPRAGAITNVASEHSVRQTPNYAAPLPVVGFRSASSSVASPSYDVGEGSPWGCSIGGGASPSAFARFRGAEGFADDHTTLAVGGGDPEQPTQLPSPQPIYSAAVGVDPRAVGPLAPAPMSAALVGREYPAPPAQAAFRGSAAEDDEYEGEGGGGEGRRSEGSLPLYWYAPATAAPGVGGAEFAPWGAPRVRTRWGGGGNNDDDDEDEDEDRRRRRRALPGEGEITDPTALALRQLMDRVDQLARQVAEGGGGKQNNKMQKAAAAAAEEEEGFGVVVRDVDEEWLGNTVLGLFFICAADALRRRP